MTYDPEIPLSGPSPAIDAPIIQTNFAQFASIFSNAAANLKQHTKLNSFFQGDHENVIMELQTQDPEVTQDLIALYNKDASSKSGTQPQLFVKIPKFLPTDQDPNNQPNNPMQLTYNQVNVTGPDQYQSFLPGGYLIYFGTTTSVGNITLVPAPTAIFLAIATPQNTNAGIPFNASTTLVNNSTFTINSNATGVFKIGWWALGSV